MAFKIEEIYNSLFEFESKSKKGKSDEPLYPIHKKLRFSEEKYNDISDWIIDNLEINEKDYVLDAGCGVGYVLTKICNTFNCIGLGISLSKNEIEYAAKKSLEIGLANNVTFEQKSFDEEFVRKFDIIIAIESLKHSSSVQNSIGNLVSSLNPGGRIFILDDYETGSRFQFLKKQVSKYWAVDSFYSLSSVIEKLVELNMNTDIIDFTSSVEYQRKRFTGLKVFIGYTLLPIARLFKLYKVYSIFFAGLCLERLYKKKAVEYKAIVALKN